MSAADLAKLGVLWLDQGMWRGERIADAGFAPGPALIHGQPKNWRPARDSP